MTLEKIITTLSISLMAMASPLAGQADPYTSDNLQAQETIAQMNARLLDEILMSAAATSMTEAGQHFERGGHYRTVREQVIEFDITGPVRFSVMEERLLQRFENNINNRGQRVTAQSPDSSTYIRSTVAAAEVSLPF